MARRCVHCQKDVNAIYLIKGKLLCVQCVPIDDVSDPSRRTVIIRLRCEALWRELVDSS